MEENENIEEVQNTESTEEQVVEQESPVSYKEDGTIVLDMSKVNELENAAVEEVVEESTETVGKDEVLQALEKVDEEEVEEVVEAVEEAIAEAEQTGQALPENIQKLVDFVNETGGDVEDYVKLNRNYDEMDNQTALKEYYERTKPHLNAEEINFLMEDKFSFDEEVDEDKDIRRKKLALKEQVAEAKTYLDGQKSKYYEEVKAKPVVNDEYHKAMDFFNRYNEESKENQKVADERSKYFEQRTVEVFNNEFKGFEYEVGDSRFRVNVKDADKLRETQSDLNNFINSHLTEDGKIKDAGKYHKAIHAAMNADTIAQHFYEQGKADALKNSVARSKNIDMSPRSAHGEVEAGGIKVRVLNDDTSPTFKFKKRK